MIKSKYIAKILAKLRIPSFDKCELVYCIVDI